MDRNNVEMSVSVEVGHLEAVTAADLDSSDLRRVDEVLLPGDVEAVDAVRALLGVAPTVDAVEATLAAGSCAQPRTARRTTPPLRNGERILISAITILSPFSESSLRILLSINPRTLASSFVPSRAYGALVTVPITSCAADL